MKCDVLAQNKNGILAHLRRGEEFRRRFAGKVQTKLQTSGGEIDPEVKIAEEETLAAIVGSSAGVQKPGQGAYGVRMQQIHEFAFKVPELRQGLLGHA